MNIKTLLALAVLVVTCAHGAHAVTVTYIQQDANYPTQFNSGGDFFNNGGTELGMWANSGSKQTAGWRMFKAAGDGTGSNRSLQIGDTFKITVAATRAIGQIGFSLNAGGTQGTSYENRTSGSRLYFNTDNYAAWYVNRSGGNTSLSYVPIQSTYKDYIFTVRITSETTADVFLTVEGTDYRAYNITMNGSAGANLDAFCIYGADMWDGDSNDNHYWKQTSTVENTGQVQLGYFLASGTYNPGVIADGLAADSTVTVSANAVTVGGDAGTAVILDNASTYTGASTINANAAARAQHANAFGTTVGGVSVTSGGKIELSGGITIGNEALTLNGTGVSSSGALHNTGGANTWIGTVNLNTDSRITVDSSTTLTLGGVISGNTLVKAGAGTLVFTNANTYTGNTEIDAGELWVGSSGTINSGSATYVGNGGTPGTVAKLFISNTTGGQTLTPSININPGDGTLSNREIGSLNTSGNNTFSGNIVRSTGGDNRALTIYTPAGGSVTFSGVISGDDSITKRGNGTAIISNAGNTHSGATRVFEGTLQVDGSIGSSATLVYNGATLKGTGTVGALEVENGGIVSPGNSVETLDAGATSFDTNGVYVFEINDFAGTYGTDPGWDKLNITGALTVNATVGQPFTIKVTSLNGSSPGAAANFNNANTYTLDIATASGGISGFSATKFSVDTNDFAHALGGGVFTVQTTGSNLQLLYTPTPPPVTNNATWDGGDSAGTFWMNPTNWANNLRPDTTGTATLNFAGATRTINTNDYTAGQQFNALFFNSGAAPFTLRGNSFAISNKVEVNSASGHTIENALTLNGPVSTEVNPVAGALTMIGGVTVNNADLIVYSDNSAGGHTLHFANTLSQGTGSSKLIVRQNATVEIAAANTLSDDIEIDRGAVHVEDGGSVAAGTAWIGNGTMTGVAAEFVITDANGGTTVARTMNINDGTGGNRTLGGANTAGTNTFSGSVNRTGGADKSITLTAAAGGTVDYAADISGDDEIVVTGGGVTRFSTTAKSSTGDMFLSGSGTTLRLNANNLLADAVDITVNTGATFDLTGFVDEVEAVYGAGDVKVDFGQLMVNHTVDRTLSGVISGSAGNVVKKGTARWTLSGANSYNGQTYIVGGTLQFDVAQAGGFNDIINVGSTGSDPDGDGTLAIGSAGVTLSNPITVRPDTSGTRYITANNTTGTATFSGPVTLNSPVTLIATNGGALTFGNTITQNANTIEIVNTADVSLNAVTGTGVLQKSVNGPGTLILNALVDVGNVYFNDGTLRVAAGGDIATSGVFYLGASVHQNNTTLELAANGIDLGGTIEIEDALGLEVKTIHTSVAGIQTLSGTVRLDDQDLILSSTNGSTLVLSGPVDMDFDVSVDTENDIYTRGPGDITFSGQLNAANGGMDLFTQGSGTVTLSGNNAGQEFQIENGGGTVFINSANAFGTAYIDKLKVNASGATTRIGVTTAPANLGILFTGSYTHTIQVDSGVTFTVPNTINDGASTGNLIKTGAGDLTVQAVNTLDGTVTVSQGTLHVSGGASFGTTTVSAGGYLKGSGTVGTLGVSGIVAPGASVGTLSAGATTFAPGGTNVWEINDFSGTYGTSPGWDRLNITGALDITATSGNPFTINIASLNGASPGSAASFTNTQGYTNKIATASGGVSGFASNKFSVVTGNFANAMNGGTWSIRQSGNDLELVFAPNQGLSPATVIKFR